VTTRQKSDDLVVPEDRRKTVQTRASGGGKGVTDQEETRQPGLPFATAEAPRRRDAGAKSRSDRSVRKPAPRPKANVKEGSVASATMEGVVGLLEEAFDKVASNKGAPGPDRMTIGVVREHLDEIVRDVAASLQDGTYTPGEIRRVFIPKSGGGERGLGIPNVVDRMVQEAVRRVLEPLYEPTFHAGSHGFRPGRGCQTAIAAARTHLAEGYAWVVDIDLEKFFDRVCHQRLMSRLAQRVEDKRLLVLIGQMLKAQVVLPDGVRVATEEGVPQGGPLSPLLSNIVLDELDQELARRGHRFVRYADDCNIYVRSEKAGQRVMASVSSFIDRRLRLKVNAGKSAVARPETRHFLGYRLRLTPEGETEVLLSERSRKRLRERIIELTPRAWGQSLRVCISAINVYLGGWFGHFGICTPGVERVINGTDAHVRRRLRAIVFRHWGTKKTIARRLIRLGARPKTAWKRVYAGRKSTWSLAHDSVAHAGLRNAYFAERGLRALLDRFRSTWAAIDAPEQLMMPW
jgi:RNA-directed DNA polymerase